jgi:uncharacterized protein (DUF486 family)
MFSVALDVFFMCKPLQLKKLWQSKELWNMPYLVAIARNWRVRWFGIFKKISRALCELLLSFTACPMFSVALDVFFVCKPLQLKKLWQSKELWNMP